MKTYEFDGEKYKAASAHQKEWGTGLISKLTLQGDEKILDLGCGDGSLTKQLSSLVPNGKVIGIDASMGMIKTAKKLSRDNLEFMQIDINDLDFFDEFDIIYSNAALHWVTDHHRLLQNSHTALKKGGIILWEFGSEGNTVNFLEVIRRNIMEDTYREYFKDFGSPWFFPSKKQYETMISEIAYSDFVITEVNRDKFFETSDAMIKWIDQPCIVPFIEWIPDVLKDRFRETVIEEMLKKTRQTDDTYFETFRRLQVYAKK